MRWRFWRRPERSRSAVAGEAAPPAPPPRVGRPAARDDEGRDAPAVPAFSGAAPGFVPALEPGEVEDLDPPSALVYGMAGLRSVVVELVSAVVAQDLAAVDAVLDRLAPHEADLEMAALIASTALGPRLVAAADVQVEDGGLRGEDAERALAQADTLVSRAEPLRRALAPHCPPSLLGYVVRDALGSSEWLAPPYGDHLEGEDRDLLLATAVLLAQTCRDGQGHPGTISAELALLLPD